MCVYVLSLWLTAKCILCTGSWARCWFFFLSWVLSWVRANQCFMHICNRKWLCHFTLWMTVKQCKVIRTVFVFCMQVPIKQRISAVNACQRHSATVTMLFFYYWSYLSAKVPLRCVARTYLIFLNNCAFARI